MNKIKTNNRGFANILLLFLVALVFILGIYLVTDHNNEDNKDNVETTYKEDANTNNDINNEIKEYIKIHFIDVGQGDSTFIELPNKETMLIDAGESYKEEIVSSYIKKLGYNKINYLVGTHPHSDHIGGLAHIINTFEINKIYMPKAISTSKTYENLLLTIADKNLKVTTAKAGVNILNNDNLNIEIISPVNEKYSDLNHYSAVIKITYENNKFLFMGDSEVINENEITVDVKSDVIKVGHHGSDTSSGYGFVYKVKPKYAIISVGENNKYDHPYKIVLDRWNKVGATIYRTDLNGNIIVTSDGNNIEIVKDK